ncbi:putative phosphotransferase protein [Pantoea sp. AS-PWVM4]|uniref:histidine phosphatase family protein n=1 Tax=Pantoea sp. AS-PWVM4 TaxID=1332069 RepID=UPI0003AC9836|nr:histidine phosphatase family protein [Pantoea sp. AS-PWVM4]ERK05846.1 putative phosphotransferase protein [Pantoea sp. AS-PWVM4]
MAITLQLICQGETLANRQSRFPADDPLCEQALPQRFGPYSQIWIAASVASIQTAQALGLSGEQVTALVEPGYGRWSGLAIRDVMTQEPDVFMRWLKGEAPPDGESLQQLMVRCEGWLTQCVALRGLHCVIVSSAVIRAMVVTVLGAPPHAFNAIDIHPLSVTQLRSDGKRWHLCPGK